MRRTGLFEYTEKRAFGEVSTQPNLDAMSHNAIDEFTRLPRNHPDKIKHAGRIKALALNGSTTAMDFFINALPALFNDVSLLPSISLTTNQQNSRALNSPTVHEALGAMLKIAQEGKSHASYWVARSLFLLYAFEYMALNNMERPVRQRGLGQAIFPGDQSISYYYTMSLTMANDEAHLLPGDAQSVVEGMIAYANSLSCVAVADLVRAYASGHALLGIKADEHQFQHWKTMQSELGDQLLQMIKLTFKLFFDAFLIHSPFNARDKDFMLMAYSIHEQLTSGRELDTSQCRSMLMQELDYRLLRKDPDALYFYARSCQYGNEFIREPNLEMAKYYYECLLKDDNCKQKAQAAYALCCLAAEKPDKQLLSQAYLHGSAEAARDLGCIAWKNGDIDQAEKYFFDALSVGRDIKISESIFSVLMKQRFVKSNEFSMALLNTVRLLIINGYHDAILIAENYCLQLKDAHLETKWRRLRSSFNVSDARDNLFHRLDNLIDKTTRAATELTESKRSKNNHGP